MAEMMDKGKTKEQLIQELQTLRHRVVQLEESESQRQQVEERLANERNLLRTLIDTLPDYIFIKDTECRFVVNNAAHIRTLGATTQEEVAGKTDLDIFSQELAETYYADDQHVIHTGQPLIGREEPTVNKTTGEKQWLSTTKVPLKDTHGRIVGLVGLNRDITELKRAQEETQRRAVQAELLYDVSRRVSGELNLETLLSEIASAVCTAFDYYGVMMLLLDDETERLTLQAISGAYTHIFPKDLSLALGEGMIGHAAATGEPVISGDVSQDPHYIQKADEKTKSELAVPIKSGQKIIGVLDLQGDEFDAFDDTDVMVMNTLADHIAMAIENARLYRAIQQELVERRETEKALRRSEERHRLVVENASEAILIIQDGLLKFVNTATEEITGYTRDKLLSRRFEKFVHPEDRDMVIERHRKRLKGEQLPPSYAFRAIDRDGNVRWVEVNAVAIPWDGRPATLNFLEDITEHVRVEAARQQAEEAVHRYADVANNMQLGLQVYQLEDFADDRTLTLITTNPAATQLTGLSPEEALGKTLEEIFPGARDRGLPETFADVVRRGLPIEFEQEVHYGEGDISDAWLSVKAFPLPGNCVGILSEDITLRKQAEESLRKSTARYQAILEDQTELICRTLPDGTLTFVNEATCRYFGRKREALIGKSHTLPIFEEDQPKIQERLAALDSQNPVITYEHRVVGPDGEIHWLQWTARAVFDEQGRQVEIQSVGRDITERVRTERLREQAEEALRQAHEELEQYALSVERQAAQFQVASEVAQEAATILDVSQLLNTAAHLISEGFGFYHSGIFLVDEQAEYAVLRAASSEGGRRMLKRGHKLEIGKVGIVGHVAATGQPRIALDVGQDAVFFNNLDLPETRSEMSLPMAVHGRTIGVLDVQSTEEAAFSEDDVTVLQTLANQLAIAVDNARLIERAEAQLRELRLLHGEYRTSIWADLSPRGRSLGYVYDRVDITPVDGLRAPAVDLSLQRGETVALAEPETALAAPIKLRERIIGALGAQKTDEVREWSANEIALVEAVSEQVAQALENAQLFAETRKSAQQMQTLYETSRVLSSSLEEEELVHAILDAIFRTLGCEYVLISTVDQKAGTIGVRHGIWGGRFDVFPEWIEAAQYPLDHPDILADIYRTGRTEIIGEWDQRFNRDIWDKYGHGRYLRIFMPIKMRERVIGVFEVSYDKRTKEHIDEDERQTLTAFADQAAIALENARLFEEAQRHAARLAAAAEVARDATAILDVDQLLDETVHLISQQFDFYHAGVFLLDDQNEYAVLRAASSEGGQRMLARHHKLPVGKVGIVGYVAGTGEPRIALDVGEDAVHFVNPDLPETRSEMGLPLNVRGQVIGVLDVQSTQEAAFSEDDIAVLQTLADQLAAAIANARLFHEVRTEAVRRALINEVQQAAVASLDREELLHEVGERLSRRLERPSALLIWEPDEQALRPVAVHDAHAADVILPDGMRVSREMNPSLFSEVVDKRQICSLNTCIQDREESADDAIPMAHRASATVLATQLGIRDGVYVPLTSREQLLGVLALAQPDGSADEGADTDRTSADIDRVSMDFIETIGVNLSVALENAQLYQDAVETTKKLQEMDRLKSQFLANMSHELRTPLNSIIGFSRVILKGIDGPLTDMQRTDLQAVYDSGQHLLGLINDILDISKIQAGKMELAFEDTDLNEIIKGVMSTAVALVKDKPIELQESVPSDLPMIRADSRRIRQVFLNLVGNAAKFTEEGFIRVQAEARPNEVVISVSDTGVGIPSEKLGTIFEAFTQVDGSSTRRAGGTGLGLSISKHFVELHGGRMWVESATNRGSMFFIALPMHATDTDRASGPAPAEDSPERPEGEVTETTLSPDAAELDHASGSVTADAQARSASIETEEPQDTLDVDRKVVLCVDDDEGVITLFRRYLSKSRPEAVGGYRVVSLTDGSAVLEKARRLQPFAITLDIMMPEKDGWQIIQELKSDPDTQHIPVIICTIVGDERDYGLSLGATDYLVKPILEDELVAALERLDHGEEHPHRVLIVDDQAEDRSLLRSMIESQDGYEAIETSGGQEAITLIREAPPSIIILDLMMPDVDGFAVLESIKADETTRSIPIIVVTAKDLTPKERDILNEGVESLLQKGLFKQQDLLEDVAAALERIEQVQHE